MNPGRFRDEERQRLLAVLAPALSSAGARELDVLLSGQPQVAALPSAT